jgi:hypothetical protein
VEINQACEGCKYPSESDDEAATGSEDHDNLNSRKNGVQAKEETRAKVRMAINKKLKNGEITEHEMKVLEEELYKEIYDEIYDELVTFSEDLEDRRKHYHDEQPENFL